MEPGWITLLLPFVCVLSRVTAFIAVLPLFAWTMVPMRVRLAIAMLLSIFFGVILPVPDFLIESTHWLQAVLLVAREIACGLMLGLVARIIFIAVQQGMLMGTQQMGFADAGIIDPSTGESARPVATLFQMIFAILFLSIDGHQMLLLIIQRSYDAFPLAQAPDPAALVNGIIQAGSMMLVFALKLAAPLLAGFLIVAVVMGVLARLMPEMNILMASMPLRVAAGLFFSILVVRTLNSFVNELVEWLDEFLMMA